MSRPTFDELVALEPRLAHLLAEAQELRRRRGRRLNVNAVFFDYARKGDGFKRRLTRLVGNVSDREGVLGTSEAYDTVYRTIYNALAGWAALPV
jgi:hypothetical protein